MVFLARQPAGLVGMVGSLALAAGLVAGCGGSSSSSSSDPGPGPGGPGIGEGDSIAELDGLTGDAESDHRLYFTSTVEEQEGLYSVLPQGDASPETELVDGEASFPGAEHYHSSYELIPIHSGSWVSGETQISDFSMDRVFYSHVSTNLGETSHRVVDTARPPADATPRQISSETSLWPIASTRRFLQFDINDPDNTELVYQDQGSGQWKKITMGDSDTEDPRTFDENFTVVAILPDLGAPGPGGYLVIDKDDNDRLKTLDRDRQVVGAPTDSGGSELEGLEFLDPMGSSAQEWGVPVAIKKEDDEDWKMWLYERPDQDSDPGTISLVLDEEDAPLVFGDALMTQGADLPGESQLTYSDEAAFFSRIDRDDGTPYIIRLDAHGWEVLDSVDEAALGVTFVIGAAGHVVWTWEASGQQVRAVDMETGDATVIDDNESSQDIETVVHGSRDAWVFYTRDVSTVDVQTDIAVAANADTGERLELHDVRWIGASTTGDGELGLLDGELQLSEVFMVLDDAQVAAVSANDPEGGKVILGDLPSPADDAEMFGVGPGPHRLLRAVDTEGAGNMYKVIYVNTREEGSLFSVGSEFDGGMEAEIGYRPVSGF